MKLYFTLSLRSYKYYLMHSACILSLGLGTYYSAYSLDAASLFSNFSFPGMQDQSMRGVHYHDMTDAIKQGLLSSIAKTLNTTSANTLGAVPEAVKKINSMIAGYIYKVAYGSRGLTWNSLALMNNRICTLVGPLTQVSLGSFTKKKRAQFIEQEDSNEDELVVDEYWKAIQVNLIKELEHIKVNLNRVLPCYSLNHYNIQYQSGFRNKIAYILHALSLTDNNQVAYYINKNMHYITLMIEFFKKAQSLEDVQQKHEELKRWISWTHESFQHIARLLESDNTEKPKAGKLPFIKPNGQQTQSPAMPSLNDLLPQGQALNNLLNL